MHYEEDMVNLLKKLKNLVSRVNRFIKNIVFRFVIDVISEYMGVEPEFVEIEISRSKLPDYRAAYFRWKALRDILLILEEMQRIEFRLSSNKIVCVCPYCAKPIFRFVEIEDLEWVKLHEAECKLVEVRNIVIELKNGLIFNDDRDGGSIAKWTKHLDDSRHS